MTVRVSRQQVELALGQDLYDLAGTYLGNPDNWRELALYNEINIFEQLPIGTPIAIPSVNEVKTIAEAWARSVVESAISDAVEPILDRLDLSGIKQPNTPDSTLINWIL